MRHYISVDLKMHRYCLESMMLPTWFTTTSGMKHNDRFEVRVDGPNAPAPGRASLEMLGEVGVRQPLAEARQLARLGTLPGGSSRPWPWISRTNEELLVLQKVVDSE